MICFSNRTTPDIVHLIRRLLVLEPDFRMTAAEVLDKLSIIMEDVIPVGISDEPLQVSKFEFGFFVY